MPDFSRNGDFVRIQSDSVIQYVALRDLRMEIAVQEDGDSLEFRYKVGNSPQQIVKDFSTLSFEQSQPGADDWEGLITVLDTLTQGTTDGGGGGGGSQTDPKLTVASISPSDGSQQPLDSSNREQMLMIYNGAEGGGTLGIDVLVPTDGEGGSGFAVGNKVLIVNMTAQPMHIVAGDEVEIHSRNGWNTLNEAGACATLIKVAVGEWELTGDIAEAVLPTQLSLVNLAANSEVGFGIQFGSAAALIIDWGDGHTDTLDAGTNFSPEHAYDDTDNDHTILVKFLSKDLLTVLNMTALPISQQPDLSGFNNLSSLQMDAQNMSFSDENTFSKALLPPNATDISIYVLIPNEENFSTEGFPTGLTQLVLENAAPGNMTIEDLPAGLQTFSMQNAANSPTITISAWPSTIQTVSFNGTPLGTFDTSLLPSTVQTLELSNTGISELNAADLPTSIISMSIDGNEMDPTTVLQNLDSNGLSNGTITIQTTDGLSEDGLTAITNLQGKGWTVNTQV